MTEDNSRPSSGNPGGPDGGVPDWRLERYLLGELPGPEMHRLADRVAADPAVRDRLEQLQRGGAALLAEHPPAWMARQIERRLRGPAGAPTTSQRAAWWPRLAPVAALALVALAALPVLRPGPVSEGTGGYGALGTAPAASPEVRLKGLEPSLLIHRRTDTGSEPLPDGALARPGDLILLQYNAAGKAYGAIISLDSRGALTRHLPAGGGGAAALQPGGLVALDYAYELDDAPGWERFYLVTGDRPFEVDEVAAAARRAGGAARLDLPSDLGQFTFELRKAETTRGERP